jgi:hemoglobin
MSITRTFAVCVAGLALARVTSADDAKKGSTLDNKEVDQRIYNVLRDVINTGAELYNRPKPNNDPNGCYRVYQGSLITLKPLLSHRPALQKAIDDALAKAEGEPSVYERAFVLRAALDRIRDETGGKAAAAKKDTLWQRLGGEKNVRKVVEDFMELEHTDPKVDFFRGGKHKLTDEQLGELKQKIVEFLSQAAGGPLKYTGKTMKEAHKGMGITNSQFDALVADLKQALDKNGAKPADRDAVLVAVEGTRKDIVEEKKEGDKKEDKEAPKKENGKPEPKKDGGKKEAPGQTVKGKLTLDGKPVAGARITFVPAAGTSEKAPSAETDANGSFEIKTAVPKGEYRIQVTAPGAKLPAVYGKPETTPLRATIPADGEIDVLLRSKSEGQ